ncbi:MAG: hypothetical protein AAB710_01285, partial [Patescibacteria group bacterium]
MIKNPIQFEAEKIHLSPEEKTAVRGALELFVAENPARSASLSETVRVAQPSRYTGHRMRTIL